MGRNIDRIRSFLETLNKGGLLKYIAEGKGDYHFSKPKLNEIGLSLSETEQNFVSITGDRRYIVCDQKGLTLRESARPRVFSYCRTKGIDYSNKPTEQTTVIPSELSDAATKAQEDYQIKPSEVPTSDGENIQQSL